ncbi:hypothetical protein Cgig2_014502 [Carnegiea gigantea]|uniref:F-box domain-containing protein n=1 Tax=Carnegiea gigantea TaxID=171969 RepID=A0A9Q1JZ13_9CARY|nr:hypothetical protein Cgig2_014502 [Carnegiea gigantea]
MNISVRPILLNDSLYCDYCLCDTVHSGRHIMIPLFLWHLNQLQWLINFQLRNRVLQVFMRASFKVTRSSVILPYPGITSAIPRYYFMEFIMITAAPDHLLFVLVLMDNIIELARKSRSMKTGTGMKKDKGSGKGSGRERLSELPDEVLVHILSFLPTVDTVRTVLVRRFGNRWTLVHSLDRPFINDRDRAEESTILMSSSNFVQNVLIFHRRPTINKFHLEILVGIPDIETWVRFAMSREAQSLSINIYSCHSDSHRLPRCVFGSQTLVSLEIMRCVIVPRTWVSMGSVRKLVLKRVSVGDSGESRN